MTLRDKIVALHRALAAHDLPHAIGGAIALAFATRDPRGTSDIDVNVFVAAEEAGRALLALPDGIEVPGDAAAVIARDGQIRLWWYGTPVDLFFDYAPVHAAAARHRRWVRFEGIDLPVLAPTELAVFKIMFDRPRDWVDVGDMLDAGTLDVASVRRALEPMLAPDDHRLARLDELAGA